VERSARGEVQLAGVEDMFEAMTRESKGLAAAGQVACRGSSASLAAWIVRWTSGKAAAPVVAAVSCAMTS
jgi:hypothetical protein